MKKRITVLFVILSLLLALLPTGASAASVIAEGSCGNHLTWQLFDDGLLSITGTGKMENPPYLGSPPWYDYSSKIKSVVIGEGVTSIADFAFDECSELVTASLPEGLKSIGRFAFDECPKLVSVNIPQTVTTIDVCAFYGCRKLKSLTFPNGMTEITGSLCNGCYALESVYLPDSITSIATDAFTDCQSLTAVTLPLNLKTLYSSAFYGCTSLKEIVLPPLLSEVGSRVFGCCDSLKKVVFTGSAPIIDEYAFYDNTFDAVYPAFQASWSDEVRQNYGGALTWTADGTVTRLFGRSRIDTAIEIAASGFSRAENVVIASQDSFADALAGVPLAYALNAPILLAGKSISRATLDEITALGAKNAFILGGDIAVSQTVEQALAEKGLNVDRIAGTTRYDTAVMIAKRLAEITQTLPDEIFFASGNNYPDALSISSIAALRGSPILYIAQDGSPISAEEYLSDHAVTSGVIIGGDVAIPEDAEVFLESNGFTSLKRYAGHNRYDTCLTILSAYSDLFSGDILCVATGNNYPDALAGGVYAAMNQAPVMLVAGRLYAGLADYTNQMKPDKVIVFGGELSVSNTVLGELTFAACK